MPRVQDRPGGFETLCASAATLTAKSWRALRTLRGAPSRTGGGVAVRAQPARHKAHRESAHVLEPNEPEALVDYGLPEHAPAGCVLNEPAIRAARSRTERTRAAIDLR